MASVKVAVRVRPFNERERDMNSKLIIDVDGKKTRILNQKVVQGKEGDLGRERYKDFTFDYSYWSFEESAGNFASQEMVYKDLGTDVISSAFEGYNACVFAYGQTGSGKTFTMMGSPENPGLIPRICRTLFSRMAEGKDSGVSYRTEVSYLEIYNERVKDLLSPSSDQHALRVREHPRLGPYVQDLSYHLVTDYQHIHELMQRGNTHRTTASTNMNNTSSRSHAIFTITFAQAGFNQDNMPCETVSKVHLVDLAGSERADTSGATGQRLKEGAHINKSLVTLGSVISALAELSSPANVSTRRSSIFIPYRDSVLTWLLKDSLGGNSKTIMIAAISPADCNYGETLSTLRYANRAKNIINKPTINEDPNVRLIRDLREEISKLRALLGNDVSLEYIALEQELQQKEAQEKVLTEEWTEKWREMQKILQEQKALGLRKAGLGVVLDSDMPHLVGIDDDVLSTGVTLYHLREGQTLIGTEEAVLPQDIMLNGNGVEPEHCRVVLENGFATLIPHQNAQCWVNTVQVDKPTKLSQGCIIVLGRTNMFRYNDPVEAAKMRKEGSRSHMNLSRLSLLSWSTPDLAWSTENLSCANISEDHERVEEIESQRATLEKEREVFKREQAEREQDWEKEQRAKRESLERAQQELEQERQRMEQEYAAQCRRLAQDWRTLEKHQLDNLAALCEREADLNLRKEMLLNERKVEQAKVETECRLIAEMKSEVADKRRELHNFATRLLQLQRGTESFGSSEKNNAVKSLQYLAATQLEHYNDNPLISDSSSESYVSVTQDAKSFNEAVSTRFTEINELEVEIQSRATAALQHQDNIAKLEIKLLDITDSLETSSSELMAMKEALAKRSEQQLKEISHKKQSMSLDLKRTTHVRRYESTDSSDLMQSPAPQLLDTNSSPDTCETFHTADSACVDAVTKLVANVNETRLLIAGMESSSNYHAHKTESEESEMSSTEDCPKRNLNSGHSTSSFEKVSPLSDPQNRRSKCHNNKYLRGTRLTVGEGSPSVSQLMRAMKRLCQRINHQKVLIMQSLENDCDKAELDAQIAVLQDLQRQYVGLELALDHHPLRPLTLDNIGSSEESDNMSTSADDAMSDLIADAKLDNDDASSGDGLRSPRSVTSFSAVSSADGLNSPHPDLCGEFVFLSSYLLRGVGSATHYEYEVQVFCSTSEHWSLLRRYKRFRELHHTMQLRYGTPVGILPFPGKVFFSNKESVAQRRRIELERYLRSLIKTCSSIPSCPLYSCRDNITKMALLEFSAFFRKGIFETGKYGTS